MKEGDEKKRDFPDGPSISQKTDNSLLFEEDYMMISLQTISHKSSTSVGTFSLEETHEKRYKGHGLPSWCLKSIYT